MTTSAAQAVASQPLFDHQCGNHIVQFFETDEYLSETVARYAGNGISEGGAAVVIAMTNHISQIEEVLSLRGFDLEKIKLSERLILLDAEQTLEKLTTDGHPDPRKFHFFIGSLIDSMVSKFGKVYAYGEMVGILWGNGKKEGTIALENLWNDLLHSKPFKLFCGYSLGAFSEESHGENFLEICQTHSHVLPSEQFMKISHPKEQLLEVALLQQHSIALQNELKRRKEIEQQLKQSEKNLSDFFENGIVSMHWVSADGIILKANKAELEMLGYNEHEYVGHHISKFHANLNAIEDIMSRLGQGESIRDFPARLRCKNGAIKDVLISSNVYRENGKFVHTRCFTREV
jgi:PAS domain S-box-containing protein